MNWVIKRVIKRVTHEQLIVNDHCEHVAVGDTAYYSGEQDSFGPVSGYIHCDECRAKMQASEDEEEEVCYDCGHTYPRKETIAWKWYDFYAPQGDEALIICHNCRGKERHLARVRKDRAEYEAEFDRDEE